MSDDVHSLGQYRCDPALHSGRGPNWLTGMRMMTTASDANTQIGMASHVYLVTESITDSYFYSVDSELLVVSQVGRLRFCTELDIIDIGPKDKAIPPSGLVYRVEVLGGPVRGFVCENYGKRLIFPTATQSALTARLTHAISKRRLQLSKIEKFLQS